MMGKMNCSEVGLRLQSYLDDELDPDRMGKIQEHLEACRDCGLDYEVYASIKSDIARTRRDPDPGAMDRLREFARTISGRIEADNQA